MDIYDSRYFCINKRIVKTLGLWPYETRKKNICIRFVVLVSMIIINVPQVISLCKNFGKNVDKMLENIFQVLYYFGISLKVVTAMAAEEKMKIVFENTARDFQTIVEKHERAILFEYAEKGRLISLGFIVYMFFALNVYVTTPMIPIVLDLVLPLNESRPRIFICNGDFLVDNHEYYLLIYLFDAWSCFLTVFILCSIDPLYAAIVEHCLALFAVIKYRLRICTNIDNKNIGVSGMNIDSAICKYIIDTIKLHKKIIKFTRLLEMSYTSYFLLEMGTSILILSVTSVIILIRIDQAFECARFILILVGLMIHLFYLTWPSQKMIDYSTNLFQATYLNEWYEISIKNQNLLKFMALRCSEPCHLTAGGLYIMNFMNFASVVKTSVSYITVFSSFR